MNLRQSLSNYILPFLLAIWLVSFFSYLGWKPGFAYNAQRYFEIFLIGCLLCAGVTVQVSFHFGRFWAIASSVLLIMMLIVIWSAENNWPAVREGMQYLALFGAMLVVAKARQISGKESFDRAALMGVVVFCFGCSLIVFEGLLLSLSIGGVDQRIVFGAFINIRIFAELQFLTLFLLPAAHYQFTSSGWRLFTALTAVFWWGLLLYTGTRSALVALPFALIILAITARGQALGWFKVLGFQILGGACFYFLLRGIVANVLDESFWGGGVGGGMSFARSSTSGRLGMWYDSWSHFLESPWFGQGPGAFACFTDGLAAGPHNLFFQLLAEWGVLVTFTSFLLALLIFWGMVLRLRDRETSDSLQLSLFVTLVTAVAASMMQGMINSPLQQMLIVLVFGWAWHVFSQTRFVSQSNSSISNAQVLRFIGVVVFLSIVLWGTKKDLELQTELLVSPDGVVNLSYGPRFWADGHDHCPDWHERYSTRNQAESY
ncbi:MAG: O-antigen ligase family protein [Marinobacter adhaerens]